MTSTVRVNMATNAILYCGLPPIEVMPQLDFLVYYRQMKGIVSLDIVSFFKFI